MAALTSSGVERALRAEPSSDDAYDLLKDYYLANSRNERAAAMMATRLGHLEADFPKYAGEFERLRDKYRIPKVEPAGLRVCRAKSLVPEWLATTQGGADAPRPPPRPQADGRTGSWPPSEPITTIAHLQSALSDTRCTDNDAGRLIAEFADTASMSDMHSQDYVVRRLDELEQQYPRHASTIRSVRSRHTAARTGAALNAAGHRPTGPVGFQQHHPAPPPAYGEHKGDNYAPPPGPPPPNAQSGYAYAQGHQQQQQQQQHYAPPAGAPPMQQGYPSAGYPSHGGGGYGGGGGYAAGSNPHAHRPPPPQQAQQHQQYPTQIGTKIVPPPPPHVQASQMHSTQEDTTGNWQPPSLTKQIFGYVRPKW